MIWPSTGRWKYLLSFPVIWMIPRNISWLTGRGLMQLLKQEQNHPMKQHEQVILLVAALNHVMQEVPSR